MLEELAKKDKMWRRIAYNICKNKQQADEIVQEMYLRFHRNPKEKYTDFYVALTLKSVYFNDIKKKQNISTDSLYYIEDKQKTFEPTDKEYELLLRAMGLTWVQTELLKETYHRSYRSIEKEYNINYGWIYRQVQEARKLILKEE